MTKMVYKLFFIVAILCAVQPPETISQNPRNSINSLYGKLFYQYYDRRDDFGESITLYEIYPNLLNHIEYPKIKKCYRIQSHKYENFVKTFVEGLMQIINSLKKKDIALPLKRLANTLKPYPGELQKFINGNEWNQAAKLMHNVAARVIFFDARYTMLKERKNSKDVKFLETDRKYLQFRLQAKIQGKEIAALLKNCITLDVGILFIPLFPFYHNRSHYHNYF